MRKIIVFLLCVAVLGLSACADRSVEIKPKGQVVVGGNVGGSVSK